MAAPTFWQNRRKRADLMVAAVFLWAPLWMVPAAIIGTPTALVTAAAITAAPLLIGAAWLLWIVMKQADPVQRMLVALFLVFVIGVAAAIPSWGLYQDW